MTASLMTPVCAFSATRGPAARSAFSVKRRAMALPSGDQPGEARNPFTLVSFRAGPPRALTVYTCACPGVAASERNAICLLSPDQATAFSDCPPAVMRCGVPPPAAETKMAGPLLVTSTHATCLPSGEMAA